MYFHFDISLIVTIFLIENTALTLKNIVEIFLFIVIFRFLYWRCAQNKVFYLLQGSCYFFYQQTRIKRIHFVRTLFTWLMTSFLIDADLHKTWFLVCKLHTSHMIQSMMSPSWIRIGIAICDLIFHYRDAKQISFYFFRDTTLYAKHEKTHENSIYIVGMMFVR